eukprot:Ihof_evm7s87 gene=Ihof_evmTU7s87
MAPKGKKSKRGDQSQRSRRSSNYALDVESDDAESVSSMASQRSMASQIAALTQDVPSDSESEPEEEDDDFELRQALDKLVEKRSSLRQEGLQLTLKVLLSNVLNESVTNKEAEILELVTQCLKKGSETEQCLAAQLLSAVFSLLDDTVREARFTKIDNMLRIMVHDKTLHGTVRAECVNTLAYLCLVACRDDVRIIEHMALFSSLFTNSHNESIVVSTLNAWALLLSCIDEQHAEDMLYVDVMPELLHHMESNDVDIRIAAAEAAAVLWECCRLSNEAFDEDNSYDLNELIELVAALTRDHAKQRAKRDRLKQRGHARAVLQYLEDHNPPEENIQCGYDQITVTSWRQMQHLNAVRDCLTSGFQLHVQNNNVIRRIFNLSDCSNNVNNSRPHYGRN